MDFKNFKYREHNIKLRGDNGIYLTDGLFYEKVGKKAFYTLRPENHFDKEGKEYISLYQIFMNSVDEHDCAMKALGSKAHWKKLIGCKWFMEGTTFSDGLVEWRKDMKARDDSLAKKTLLNEAGIGNVTAAKAILENNKEKNPVGRANKDKPSKKKESTSASILKLASGGNE